MVLDFKSELSVFVSLEVDLDENLVVFVDDLLRVVFYLSVSYDILRVNSLLVPALNLEVHEELRLFQA